MIQRERLKELNNKPLQEGSYILYWMQAAQRAEWNHALEYAIQKANELQKPLLVLFSLTDRFPEANARHYLFLLEGLQETQRKLAQREIRMVVYLGDPVENVAQFSQKATFLVTDRGYLRIQREWREKVAQQVNCPFWQVETEVIVPVEVVSPHEEYGAYTIRPKLKKQLNRYLIPLREETVRIPSLSFPAFPHELDLSAPEKILEYLGIDKNIALLPHLGGTDRAKAKLKEFIAHHLSRYPTSRNDPSQDTLSAMSPYLHFGQISPLFITQEIIGAPVPEEVKETYLEELIVRRELSMNFVFYNPHYDSFQGLPSWAQDTLRKHRRDSRKYHYHLEDFENARTHDVLWNAAQKELVKTGKIHGYVRMYWGKKVLEWSNDPEEAFHTLLYLNNKYALDGRDPNSFAGIAWCFGKHDRAFGERPIFGKVRYMGKGNVRKKSIERAYVERIERM
ncbi:MAG: deoxyribodipyrimidine photo-lyase [Candidatus Atribacteria bacterium]|nr:deoxyribodipyrimidine photo-lyase [Candidatus Atribacteria bacterium]